MASHQKTKEKMAKKPTMKICGEVGSQRAHKGDGKEIAFGPYYNRTVSMKELKVGNSQVTEMVSLIKREEVSEGSFKFSLYDDKGCILPTKGYGPRFRATLLEKVRLEDDFSEVKQEFYPLIKRLMDVSMNWGVEFTFRGLSKFIPYLMEWTNCILDRYEQPLRAAGIYGLVGVSQFPYDYNKEVWKAFCEQWGPLTNTLHHGSGEVGISLNDLKHIGGLPILGDPYEEYLPPNEQLCSYPSTVTELLKIHAELCQHEDKNQEVSWYKWIKHFYRGKKEFDAYGEEHPSSRKRKSPVVTSSKGNVKKPLPLCVSDEGEPVAYLALLLSRFVLPHGSDSVRPETFVMASFMAQGKKISLAPTVLGHIYHGLGKIATFHGNPGSAKPTFGIHFVIGWLAEYFPCLYPSRPEDDIRGKFPLLAKYARVNGNDMPLYQARLVFRGIEHFFHRTMSFGAKNEGDDLVEVGGLPDQQFEQLLSIRPSVLPIRLGDILMLQPYYPNRFPLQFGFDQGVPRNGLKFDFSKRTRCSLEEIVKAYDRFFRKNTGTHFHIPPEYHRGTYTYAYSSWWTRITTPYLSQSCHKVKSILLKKNCIEREPNFVIKDTRIVTSGLRGAVRVSQRKDTHAIPLLLSNSSSRFDTDTSKRKKSVTEKQQLSLVEEVDDLPCRISISDDINPKRVRHNKAEKSDSSQSVGFEDLPMHDNLIDVDYGNFEEGTSTPADKANQSIIAIVAMPESSRNLRPENVKMLPLQSDSVTLQDILSSIRKGWVRDSIIEGVSSIVKTILDLKSPQRLFDHRSQILYEIKTLQAITTINLVNLDWFILKVQNLLSDAEVVTTLAIGVNIQHVQALTTQLAHCSSELSAKRTHLSSLSEKAPSLKERDIEISTLKEKVREMEIKLEADKINLTAESVKVQNSIFEEEKKLQELQDELDQSGQEKIEEVNLKTQHIHALIDKINAFTSCS